MRAVAHGVLALLALTLDAFAYGERYRGPVAEVDPNLRQMDDPPPPESMGGPPTPTPMPGPARRFPSPTFESWRFWWHHNEEGLLDAPRNDPIVDPAILEERVVPLLDRLARGLAPKVEGFGHQRDLQSTAILGLARLGRAERIPLLIELAEDRKGEHPHQAQESACLALGLMGRRTPEALGFLRPLVADRSGDIGRRRCNAMFSLGLLGGPAAGADPAGLAVLSAAALGPVDPSVRRSALVGMGLLGDRAAVPDLLQWIAEGRIGDDALDDREVAYAIAALGKIGAPGTAGGSGREVIDALGVALRGAPPLPRFSAAIALGRIGVAGDEGTASACAAHLRDAIAREAWTPGAPQTAQFAIAALGRIAAAPMRTPAEREGILKTLAGVLREGAEGPRAFAALALAIGGRRLEGEARERVAAALREALARSGGSAECGGAAVVALGLMRDAASAATLRKMLVSTEGDPRLRADAALALGLLGDAASIPELRKGVEQRARWDLRYQATLALGLLRDRGAVEPLLVRIGDVKAGRVHKGAAARALGWIGDAGAVDPLIAITGDFEVNECERDAAVLALVRVVSGGKDADLTPISEDVNYRAWYYALGEVLNLL